MIEQQIIQQKLKHYRIQEYIASYLGYSGFSHVDVHRTPLGEKIIIYTTKPGIVVGKSGENIRELTQTLKNRFKIDNPQIEVAEVTEPMFDAQLVSSFIANSFLRFGPKRFKSSGYKTLENIMKAGAIGAEIVISGRGIPGTRAKSWRFSAGYLKKSGDVLMSKVKKGYSAANLRSGTIGIKVMILTPDIKLPDKIKIHFKDKIINVEEISNQSQKEHKEKIKDKITEEHDGNPKEE